MTSEDPSHSEEDYTEPESSVDALLREISRAPRPSVLPLTTAELPAAVHKALESTLRSQRSLTIGEVVDERYLLEEVLGAGGMGVVYGAQQLSTGRKVALKWMHRRNDERTNAEHDAAFQRFLREAQATARIRHPNVVDVYDAGKDPNTPYLVMERLTGETLAARIGRGPLSWDEALKIMLPVLEGVAEAHRAGIIHRDLKPDNVFLAREGEQLVPKVLDFGVSRLRPTDEHGDGEPSLTRTGTVLGTPAYMALEQLRAVGVDARTDVYALGVVLYEMLSGKRPFDARNAADFAALLSCEKPAPLSQKCPELRGARESVVHRALAREPGDRYPSVEAFAEALKKAKKSSLTLRYGVLVAAGSVLAVAALALGTGAPHVRQVERATLTGEVRPQLAPPPPAEITRGESSSSAIPTMTSASDLKVEVKRTARASKSPPTVRTAAAHPALPQSESKRGLSSLVHEDFQASTKDTQGSHEVPTTRASIELARDQF